MNSTFSLSIISIIMPVLAAIFILITITVILVFIGKNKQTQSSTIHQKSLEVLVQNLRADNAVLKSELSEIKETVNSIHKMMKEIE